jgi:hypothetical protein
MQRLITIEPCCYDIIGRRCITICVLLWECDQLETSMSYFDYTAINHASSQPEHQSGEAPGVTR